MTSGPREDQPGSVCPACGDNIPESVEACPGCGFDWNAQSTEPEPVRTRFAAGACHHCGYDLWNIDSPLCPECGTPVVPTVDPNPERLAEWRLVRRGLTALVACTSVTLVGALVLAAERWGISIAIVGCILHAGLTYTARAIVRSKYGIARKLGRDAVPRSGFAFWGLALGWFVWLALLLTTCTEAANA